MNISYKFTEGFKYSSYRRIVVYLVMSIMIYRKEYLSGFSTANKIAKKKIWMIQWRSWWIKPKSWNKRTRGKEQSTFFKPRRYTILLQCMQGDKEGFPLQHTVRNDQRWKHWDKKRRGAYYHQFIYFSTSFFSFSSRFILFEVIYSLVRANHFERILPCTLTQGE